MINRELIRLKVVQLIYAYYKNEGKTIEVAEKELMFSLGKAHELYLYLLTLLVEVQQMAARRHESTVARCQRLNLPVEEETADKRLAENALIKKFAENTQLLEYIENVKGEWIEEEAFVKKIYTRFVDDQAMENYLAEADFSFNADRELIRRLYKQHVCNNDDFDSLLEDHSLYWNDDKEIVDSFVLKTIKRFTAESTAEQPLLPEFASDDDRTFAVELFRTTIERGEEMRDILRNGCKNWEFNRLAFMDIVIAQIALTEILTFPTIPLAVSLNEYLDIAKVYSTPRSASFLNGVLDHIVKQFKAENIITK